MIFSNKLCPCVYALVLKCSWNVSQNMKAHHSCEKSDVKNARSMMTDSQLVFTQVFVVHCCIYIKPHQALTFQFFMVCRKLHIATHDLQNILESLYSMFPYCSQFSAALVLIADYLYGLRLCRSILCSKNGPRQMLVPCKEQTLGAASKSISWNHGLHLDQRSSFYGAKDLRSRWVGGNGLVLWHLELEELASRGPKATRSSDAWEAVEEARCFSGEGGPFALSIAPSGEAEKVQAWSRSKPKGWQRGLGSEDDPPLMLHLWGVSSLCMF